MKPDSPVIVDVRAVDVGYFSVKTSFGRLESASGVSISTHLFPSLAPRMPSNMDLRSVMTSRPDGTVVEVDGVNYFVGRDAVLHSSGREPRTVLDGYCLSDKYMALLLGSLHYIAKDEGYPSELIIRQLVVGLPLNTFSEHHTKLQAKVIGEHLLPNPTNPDSRIRVTVQRCTVMVQPQGALLNHSMADRSIFEDTKWNLVVDAGGGTLDWFLARGRQPNWQRSGAYSKSMLACAYAVADRINPKWRDSYEIIDRIDRAIRSQSESFTTAGVTYNLKDYEADIEAVVKESTEKMHEKVDIFDNLDTIVFTGGGAPVFYNYMRKTYPHLARIMQIDPDPVFANVKGFQIAGEYMAGAHK